MNHQVGIYKLTVELAGHHISPSEIQLQLTAVLPAYLGELNLDAQLSGHIFNKPDFRVKIEKLYGNVLDKKLQGNADLHYSAKQTNIQRLQASIGDNLLDIQGKLGVSNALNFKLDAHDLHELSPDLTGSVFAQGSLTGDIAQPAMKFKLESTGLGFQDQQIASMKSNAGSCYFCESLFWASQPKQTAKT